MKEFLKLILTDIEVAKQFLLLMESSFIKKFLFLFLNTELRCVLRNRFQNFIWKKNFKLSTLILYHFSKSKYNCDIHYLAKIGKGLRIGHASDIIIGSDVVIGDNVTIFNGVTLGNKYVDDPNRKPKMPIIGNNVVLGTGCKVLGDVTIGENAVIGANSIIINNVKPFSVVVGVH